MTLIKSIILCLTIVVFSNISSAQSSDPIPNVTLKENKSNNTLSEIKSIMRINKPDTYSKISFSKNYSDDHTKFDESFQKYLTFSQNESRFNLNFVKVSPYRNSGGGSYNLSLIRNGYDPYYPNANFQPNLFQEFIYSTVASCLNIVRN